MEMKHHYGKWGSKKPESSDKEAQKKQPEPAAELPMDEIATKLTRAELKDLFLKMKDDNLVIRSAAVNKLGKIINKVRDAFRDEIISNLGKVIQDKPQVSEPAVDILVTVGKQAVPMIMEGLESENYWIVSSSMR